jgi:dihydroxy-acid dehydratase
MSENAVLGPGVCAGLGTANTMHLACEALGMALPGSTPIRANGDRMWTALDLSARRIVAAVLANTRPRDVLTPAAFRNAVCAVLSVSGSINSVKHLQAVAAEAEADVDVYRLFETLADRVPLITAIRPNGEAPIEDFEDAGGTMAVLKQLEPLLDGTALTMTGQTLAENLAGYEVPGPEVIRPLDRPLGTRPSIVLIRGSLCPDGGIVKLAVADDRRLEFEGPALVFESPLEALAGVRAGSDLPGGRPPVPPDARPMEEQGDRARRVKPGDVVVLRGQGPIGSPGMGMASQLVFALDGAGLTGQVAVVTDGQLSGLVNKGIVVGEVSPEAGRGGPLALVRDGDLIRIDVPGRTADLDVPAGELAARAASLKAQQAAPDPASPEGDPRPPERGWLSIYARTVRPLPEGAVLIPDPKVRQ